MLREERKWNHIKCSLKSEKTIKKSGLYFKKVTKKPINKPDSAEQAGASQGRRKYPYTFQHLGWKYRKTDIF